MDPKGVPAKLMTQRASSHRLKLSEARVQVHRLGPPDLRTTELQDFVDRRGGRCDSRRQRTKGFDLTVARVRGIRIRSEAGSFHFILQST